MIVKVRIAPIENWCEHAQEWAKTHPEMLSWPGKVVEILPHTMQTNLGGEREWQSSEATDELLDPSWFVKGLPGYFCESMLEMD